jgi:hypothetical protein
MALATPGAGTVASIPATSHVDNAARAAATTAPTPASIPASPVLRIQPMARTATSRPMAPVNEAVPKSATSDTRVRARGSSVRRLA